jgi:hypothetical protein
MQQQQKAMGVVKKDPISPPAKVETPNSFFVWRRNPEKQTLPLPTLPVLKKKDSDDLALAPSVVAKRKRLIRFLCGTRTKRVRW